MQGVGQPVHHVRLGVADRLHPQPSPEGEEVGVRVRIEHLDHGGDREAAQAGPGSGEIPVAAVRQHHDRPRLGLSTTQPGRLRHLHPSHDLVGSPARQGEHLGQRPQVRTAGPQPPAGRRPARPAATPRLWRRLVRWRPWVARPRAPHRARSARAADAADSAQRGPAGPVDTADGPVPPAGHAVARLGLTVDRAAALSDGDQSGHRQEHDGDLQHVRDAEAGQQGSGQDDQQPVGAGRDPPVGLEAETLGPSAHVRGQLTEDERGQGEARPHRFLLLVGEVEQQTAEHRTVAEPVETGVQEGSPRRGRTAQLGHLAVEHVGEHEEGDDQRSLPQPAHRVADQRAEHHAQGADRGDQVRRDPEAVEEQGQRGDQPGSAGPETLQHQAPGGRGGAGGLGAGPGGVQQLPGLVEQLGHGLGLGDDRQEVRVTAPARHHVLVQVRGDPGPGHRALVDPEVEAVRTADRPGHPHGLLGERTDLGQLVGGHVGQVGHVPVRADQQVPRRVRDRGSSTT